MNVIEIRSEAQFVNFVRTAEPLTFHYLVAESEFLTASGDGKPVEMLWLCGEWRPTQQEIDRIVANVVRDFPDEPPRAGEQHKGGGHRCPPAFLS